MEQIWIWELKNGKLFKNLEAMGKYLDGVINSYDQKQNGPVLDIEFKNILGFIKNGELYKIK